MDARISSRPEALVAAVIATIFVVSAAGWADERKPAQKPQVPLADVEAEKNEPGEASELAQNVFLPADRNLLQRLARAKALLERGDYAEAVSNLGAILEEERLPRGRGGKRDRPEDFFFQPDKKIPIFRSLKAEAHRLIGEMPPRGRELYEMKYGAPARQMLADAAAAGDVLGLAEVSRRFFHTQAGYEATLLLGLHHLDRGRPLAAAVTLKRLRDSAAGADQFEPVLSLATAAGWYHAGMPDSALQTLVALKKLYPGGVLEIAGRQVPMFTNDAQAMDWLAAQAGPLQTSGPAETHRWLMFRGGPSRNVSTPGSSPLLNTCWRVPVTDDPLVEHALQQLRETAREREFPALPGLHPLAVQDVVLMRTAQNLVAVDFATGKRLWEVPMDEGPEDGFSSAAGESLLRHSSQRAAALGQRIWEDATYGTLSSDGRYVFSIEDLEVVTDATVARQIIIGGRPQMYPGARATFNRLVAHDIRSGKRKWEVGGAATDRFTLPMAGTFFLGPPLPLMGQLYVLGEVKGEIRLMALDADKGTPQWSQQLAVVETNILQDPWRRVAGVSPSYADGILVCPTASGAVVAIDLATRSLLWGYRYPQITEGRRAPHQIVAQRIAGFSRGDAGDRWVDAMATVVEGRVLIAPAESDQLHCLNLIDGKLLWKRPCGDDLYVACVHQGKVVLAGRRQVRAIRLADGEPAWEGRAPALPEDSMPSGRGYLSGDYYYLPLSNAAVATVDVAAGNITHVAKSREGYVPGNLICYKGKVISQSLDGLTAFHQLEAIRAEVDKRLETDAKDPMALTLRSEILLDAGKRREAAALLRRSLELQPDPRTRDLLRDTLLEGLREDFAAHRGRIAEIEPLLDSPELRSTYLRLMAAGLSREGQWQEALKRCRELIGLLGPKPRLEEVSKALSVRQDRWIQGQLSALRQAGPQAAEEIDRTARDRRKALQPGDSDALRRFLECFGFHPAATDAARELAARLVGGGRLLEAELLLWRQQQSPDPAQAAAALAELAQLLCNAGREEDAAVCYQRLGKEFADVVCRDGKTGRQLVEALPAESSLRRSPQAAAVWPRASVEVSVESPARRARMFSYGRFAMEYEGTPAPFFRDLTIQFDQNRRLLMAQDNLGRQRWQVSLVDSNDQGFYGFNRNLMHAHVRGHLLLLVMRDKILALDTLTTSPSASPRVLWSQDLSEPAMQMPNLPPVPLRAGNFLWAQPRAWQAYGIDTSGLGPVNDRYVCFQHFRNIVAADPLTGEPLWIRRDLAPGASLFGDEEMVFVVPPEKNEATVLRAIDGELLGTRRLPDPPQPAPGAAIAGTAETAARSPFREDCLETIGRNVLLWRSDEGRRVLQLFDPWQQRELWPPRKFAGNAHVASIPGEAVGVLEPDGRFVLVALPSGRIVADLKLTPEPELVEIALVRSGDQYILVTHSPLREVLEAPPIQPMPGVLHKPISHGRVYALDLEGKLLWPAPVVINNQHFLLSQPAAIPILTFACQVYKRELTGSGRYITSILCLDKRTGQTVYKKEFPDSTGVFEIVGDTEKKTVELIVQRSVVTLKFLDKRAADPGQAKTSGTAAAMWKALKRAFAPSEAPSP